MPSRNRMLMLGVLMLTLSGMVVMASLKSKGYNSPAQSVQSAQDRVDREQYPIADYAASDPVEPGQRAMRQARGNRYNGRGSQETGGGVQQEDEPVESLIFRTVPANSTQAIPASRSDAILNGDVTDARAYLSTDKTGVYSEFIIRPGETLKDDPRGSLAPNKSITVLREGGRVRFPSGQINLYGIYGEGMPRNGRRYIFFLKCDKETDSYVILTAYELREGKVYPIDGFNPHQKSFEPPFDAYEGMDEKKFLNTVLDLLDHSSSKSGKESGNQ